MSQEWMHCLDMLVLEVANELANLSFRDGLSLCELTHSMHYLEEGVRGACLVLTHDAAPSVLTDKTPGSKVESQ